MKCYDAFTSLVTNDIGIHNYLFILMTILVTHVKSIIKLLWPSMAYKRKRIILQVTQAYKITLYFLISTVMRMCKLLLIVMSLLVIRLYECIKTIYECCCNAL